MTFKVLIEVPLSIYSGYGNDGIGLVRAFQNYGADVYVQPSAVQTPIDVETAMVLTKELQAPFDLIIQHVDPGTLKADEDLKRATPLLVGWTMWEYSNLLNLRGRSGLAKKIKNFDAIVGYDSVSAECFEPYFKKPILIQQGGYWPQDWTYLERDWDSPEFHFCQVGVLAGRKDPFKTIQAFISAKQQDPEFNRWARLSLKTTAPGLHSKIEDMLGEDNDPKTGKPWPDGRRHEVDEDGNPYTSIRIFYDVWPTSILKEFYRVQHVLISPSRGEGKNMPALEFQSTGGAVIATNWGGHTQWLNSEYAYPLDYTLAPMDDLQSKTWNANASVEHLTELMLHTFHNRNEVKEKGLLASQIIPQISSWDVVVARLIEKLKDLPGGDTLWAKAVMAQSENDGD